MKERATKEQWLTWFFENIDLGPNDSKIIDNMKRQFMGSIGKNLPTGYNYDSYLKNCLDE